MFLTEAVLPRFAESRKSEAEFDDPHFEAKDRA